MLDSDVQHRNQIRRTVRCESAELGRASADLSICLLRERECLTTVSLWLIVDRTGLAGEADARSGKVVIAKGKLISELGTPLIWGSVDRRRFPY